MKKIKCTATAVLASFAISACGGDDDSNNDDLIAALEAQNKQMQTVIENSSGTVAAPVNLSAKVFNTSTDEYENDIIFKVKVGQTWREEQQINDGVINITDLPSSSNYDIVISSPNDSFMARAFFGITPEATAEMFRDLGQILVAQGQEYSFKVINSETEENITNLDFYSYSHHQHNGSVASDYKLYAHHSSFEVDAAMYTITLPKGLHSDVFASVDFDNDGERDFEPNSSWVNASGSRIYIESYNLEDLNELALRKAEIVDPNFKTAVLNVSVLDEELNQIPGLNLEIDDAINGNLSSTFNEESGQYEFTAKLANSYTSVTILVPAFTYNETNYKSSTIRIREYNEQSYRIERSNEGSYIVNKDISEFDLAIKPRYDLGGASNLSIVYRADELSETEQGLKIFFSEGVNVDEMSTNIVARNSYVVTKGNDDPNDTILPGTTYIDNTDKSVEVDSHLSLNNTLLTIKPKAKLMAGTYRYHLSHVTAISDEVEKVFNDNWQFTVDDTSVFNINDLKLDNANYTTNGLTVVTSNTAGIATTSTDNRRSTQLIIPNSIAQLKTLKLVKQIVTENGVARNDINQYDIVSNGSLNYVSRAYFLSNAENEYVTGASVVRGAVQTYGFSYYLNTEYLYDNKVGNENSILFDYAYETLAGEIKTGQITLYVN